MLVYGIFCVRIWSIQGDLCYRRRRLNETFSLRREASMQYKQDPSDQAIDFGVSCNILHPIFQPQSTNTSSSETTRTLP
jgi:hypothetical protein